MGKKTISIKPAEEITIVDSITGEKYDAIFNMRSVMYFQEKLYEFGIGTDSNCDITALCLYSAINAWKKNSISYAGAEELSKRMGIASAKEINDMFMSGIYESMGEEQKETVKKMMAQYVIKIGSR